MNDLTLLIIALSAAFIGMIIAVLAKKISFSIIGWMACCVLAFIFASISDNSYDSIPYNETVEESYELRNLNDSLFFLTGEDNMITFFDADGISHVVKYYEMELKDSQDNTAKIEIYGRADDGIEWLMRSSRKRVIIYMPETIK